MQGPCVLNASEKVANKYTAKFSTSDTDQKGIKEPCAYEDPIQKSNKKLNTSSKNFESIDLDQEHATYESVEV